MDAEVDGEPRGGGPANSGGAVIDRDSAGLPGNRAMGSTPECASRFEVADTYSQINYQGRPVRVGPLSCAGLF